MGLRVGSAQTRTNTGSKPKDFTLTEMANKSVPIGAIITNVTFVGANAFRDRTSLTSFTGLNVKKIEYGAFSGCTNLTELNTPNVITFGGGGSSDSTFYNCSKLETVNLPLCTTYDNNASSSFKNCTKLEHFNAPLIRRFGSGSFDNDTSLEYLYLPNLELMSGWLFENTGLKGIEFHKLSELPSNAFKNSSSLSTIVSKKSSIIGLGNISAFTGTPFASNGSGGTLYVKESLIESYQEATNWSAILAYANNQIKKYEGTTYETHQIDGTPKLSYVETSFTRYDGLKYNTDGTTSVNSANMSSDPNILISKGGSNEWEFVSQVTYNSTNSANMQAQEFDDNNHFVGMATSYYWGDRTIDGETLHIWKMLFPNNGTKFRFCCAAKSSLDTKPYYLYKIVRNS